MILSGKEIARHMGKDIFIPALRPPAPKPQQL